VQFEWDPAKDRKNQQKHGVSLREAATIFDDLLQWTVPDPDHSIEEHRYLTTGLSKEGRLLIVAHSEVSDDRIRIINARLVTARERRTYEEG
jgi:uncharacterized DUF497 family protein